jgi:hypothetical protein
MFHVICDLAELASVPAECAVFVELAGYDLAEARVQVEQAAAAVGRRLAPGAACSDGVCRFCLRPAEGEVIE